MWAFALPPAMRALPVCVPRTLTSLAFFLPSASVGTVSAWTQLTTLRKLKLHLNVDSDVVPALLRSNAASLTSLTISRASERLPSLPIGDVCLPHLRVLKLSLPFYNDPGGCIASFLARHASQLTHLSLLDCSTTALGLRQPLHMPHLRSLRVQILAPFDLLRLWIPTGQLHSLRLDGVGPMPQPPFEAGSFDECARHVTAFPVYSGRGRVREFLDLAMRLKRLESLPLNITPPQLSSLSNQAAYRVRALHCLIDRAPLAPLRRFTNLTRLGLSVGRDPNSVQRPPDSLVLPRLKHLELHFCDGSEEPLLPLLRHFVHSHRLASLCIYPAAGELRSSHWEAFFSEAEAAGLALLIFKQKFDFPPVVRLPIAKFRHLQICHHLVRDRPYLE